MLDYTYYGDLEVKLISPIDQLDLTDCLKAISWGVSAHEPGTPMLYSGTISLCLSAHAESRGLTINDFNEQVRPSLWMPGTAALVLKLYDTELRFRITDFQFDEFTKQGSAKVTQQLQLYTVSLPDADKVFTMQPYEAPVTSIVYRAATVTNNWANDKIAVGDISPYAPGSNIGSTVYGQMSSANLWSESQSLLTHTWAWLHQSLQDEKVNASHLDYNAVPLLLTRPTSLVNIKPEASISYRAPRVIAHGSADLPADDLCNNDGNESDNGYPPSEYVETMSELGIIMPDVYSDNGSKVPVVAESKLVEYLYKTPGTTRVYNGPAGIFSETLTWLPEEDPAMNEQSQLWKTITTNSKCLGVLFPEEYPGSVVLYPYERIVETYLNRVTYRSLGLIDPVKYPGILALSQVKHEKLRDKPKDNHCAKTVVGGHVTTDYVKPAPVRKIEKPLTTKSFKAEAQLVPLYRPALDYPFTFDIGWCPSFGFADLVAQRVLLREKIRSSTDLVQMALPRELIEAYCPVFFRLAVRDKLYFADSVQYKVEIEAGGNVKAGVNLIGCQLGSVTTIRESLPPLMFFGSGNAVDRELAKYSNEVYATAGVGLRWQ